MPARSSTTVPTAPQALCLDLVQWVAERPRSHDDVMAAWRTSCPRLTVWEDVVDAGYVHSRRDASGEVRVTATAAGRRFLVEHGRQVASQVE